MRWITESLRSLRRGVKELFIPGWGDIERFIDGVLWLYFMLISLFGRLSFSPFPPSPCSTSSIAIAGTVVFSEIMMLPNGMSKGCGSVCRSFRSKFVLILLRSVVEFAEPEEAQKAIRELSDKTLLGRPLFIREVGSSLHFSSLLLTASRNRTERTMRDTEQLPSPVEQATWAQERSLDREDSKDKDSQVTDSPEDSRVEEVSRVDSKVAEEDSEVEEDSSPLPPLLLVKVDISPLLESVLLLIVSRDRSLMRHCDGSFRSTSDGKI